MAVMARIRDEKGMFSITEVVGELTLDRSDHSVRMHKPYHVPAGWISRAGRTLAADVFVPSLDHATDARAVITTWSGAHADDISINRTTLVPRVGRDHVYSRNTLDVHLDLVRAGTNSFSTFSATTHHGIEVMWPGIVLFVRFDEPAIDTPASGPGDLRIFTDAFDGPWTAVTPEDGSARIENSAVSFEGSQVLQVTPSQSFFSLLELSPPTPEPTADYVALRFAIHPNDMAVKSFHRLNLIVWDQEIALLTRGISLRGLDFTRNEWQVLEIPLQEFGFRYPYLETLRFEGRLSEAFLVDDVRLVRSAVETSLAQVPEAHQPTDLHLYSNALNPFNSETVISFDLPQEGTALLSVYSLTGQRVATIVDRALTAGHHQVRWDSRADDGRRLASGVYLYHLQAQQSSRTGKLLLLR